MLLEGFVQAALPDVGMLQTPLQGGSTDIRFRSPSGYLVRLQDMGGGIEQLLMAATVLETTGDESTVFLEEPESHLHPGAQRYLIERLCRGERQVFVTTHSPVFVNSTRPQRMYQVSYQNRRTTVATIGATDTLRDVLDDIGVRNSDVLLSDAVLFVEGPSDQKVFGAWSEVLGESVSEHNVTVLHLGGGEYAQRSARPRSETLEGISTRAIVPHMFIIDRDERGDAEIAKLRQALKERLHVLDRRELENYLLVPAAIRDALVEKYRQDPGIRSRVEATPHNAIEHMIQQAADALFWRVLLKRIRADLKGLVGGVFPREAVERLEDEAKRGRLAALIERAIRTRLRHYLDELDIASIVRHHKQTLMKEWRVPAARRDIAPGEEILASVFAHFGGRYDKATDGERIAKRMPREAVAAEIRGLISRIGQLSRMQIR